VSPGTGANTTHTLAASGVALATGVVEFLQRPGPKGEVYGMVEPVLVAASEYASQSLLGRDNIFRQALSMFLITWFFGYVLYFSTAGLSYIFVYDKDNFKHPKMLKNQMALEIKTAVQSIPIMTALTVPWFVAEVRGYSKMYMDSNKYGKWYMVFQFPLFLLFTDMLIYCIHRWLHTPSVYKRLHKPHHKWIVPTPFASHAFHPIDGYAQSLPYHIFPFIFPLHKVAYIALFSIVNVWTVLIHDGEYLANDPIVNGSACHTIHHMYFNYNYGQYTTLWDRLGGSYRTPDEELFNRHLRKDETVIARINGELEQILDEVEGDDDRVYLNSESKKTR
jgi:lathosterol oxidase